MTENNSLLAALRMMHTLLEVDDTEELLRKGLELTLQVLDCERGLLIVEKSLDNFDVLEKAGTTEFSVSFSSTAMRLVKEKNRPVLISDTGEDDVFKIQESINKSDIRSVLCSNLDLPESAFPGGCLFLYLDSHTNRRAFLGEDLETFRQLSVLMSALVKKSEIVAEKDTTIEALLGQVKEKQFEDLVFQSQSFDKCLKTIKQGAPTDAPILLIGETGTGKEMIAKAIHKISTRCNASFVPVNCGAIPEGLLESEFFGHEKGAFTGAVAMKKGLFEEASGGTIFLDEVGEIPLALQVKFLRALQEKEVQRVGALTPIKVDVRVVCATNLNLEQEVENNKFRRDLYFRISVLQVGIPPVRERERDSFLLAKYFLNQYCEAYGGKNLKFSKEAEKAILMYNWPGNVREIQNLVQRAVITASGESIGSEELGLDGKEKYEQTSLRDAREALDRKMIAYAMEKAPGNLTNAAKILDIDRKSLRILLEKYGISQG
ncbi:MAG: sigma-54-dependent Fis family transcriptional regulator [Fibrobacteria bacterium]|nr:sigma-54-dependent Fis family transcriptional regulator [Fibrobacteria bacterium]